MDDIRMDYRQCVEDAADAIYVYRGDGSVLYANRQAALMLGYTIEELKNLNMYDLDPASVVSGIFGIKNLGNGRWPLMCRRLLDRRDGYVEPVEIRVNPVTGVEDTYIAVVRDVQQDVTLERQLLQAQKMEVIGTLAGGIAHDFNNILAAILGYGQIVKDQLGPDSPVLNDVDQIINGGIRASDLVRQILTFSRQDEVELKPINIGSLIKEVLKLLRASLPSTIDLQQDIANDCSEVMADVSQVHQVLMNLCTNAKHAIGEKVGTLFVGLAELQILFPEKLADQPMIAPGVYVVLTVRDSGEGMDDETLVRVFDPFFSTKGKDVGTGLGLSIVHGIVKKMQGDITVSSSLGRGTEFMVYFPVEEGAAENNTINLDGDILKGDERVMLVDDEPAVCITLKRMLEKNGYTVSAYSSSIEAVKAYREDPEHYDLVITDLTMPEMTGLELAREVHSFREEMPIILMSGFGIDIDEHKLTAAGVNEFIVKPFTCRDITEIVRKVVANG